MECVALAMAQAIATPVRMSEVKQPTYNYNKIILLSHRGVAPRNRTLPVSRLTPFEMLSETSFSSPCVGQSYYNPQTS